MKNLFFISIFFFLFSCGNDTQTKTNADEASSKTEQNQSNSAAKTPQNTTEDETKVLTKNEIKEETKPEKAAKNISAKSNSTTESKNKNSTFFPPAKDETEAKAQIEAEKAKSMAEKMRLEEEMKKAEDAKKAKTAAEEKKKKEMATKKQQQESGSLFESDLKRPTVEASLHDEFDALLRKYVSSTGKVNYKGLKNDEAKLDSYLKKLEGTDVEKSWSRNKALAFWINAYNAFTVKLILKNYPVKSIMDLHNGKPWDVKWIKLDQRTLSLNNIENDIIRPKYNEPRIHFAVNCAAKSCPPLLNKAWTESNLNSNFERQTKSFINNSTYNTISSNNVEISKIFDWYGKDFGNLIDYLNKYSKTKIAAGTSINFKSYNWDLNN